MNSSLKRTFYWFLSLIIVNMLVVGNSNSAMAPIITYLLSNNTCTTQVNSGSSIQAAINNASAGDIICVDSGIYNEAVIVENTENLTIIGKNFPRITKNLVILASAKGTIIKGFEFNLYGMCNEAAIALRTGTHNVTIENNKFYNSHLGGIDVESTTNGTHIPNENLIIRGNYFEKIPTAISIVGKNHLVEKNTIVHTTQTVPHPTLGQCQFVNNLDADGIKFYGQDHIIRYNRFEDLNFYTDGSLYNPIAADPLIHDSHTDCFQTSGMSWFSDDNTYRNNKTNNIRIYNNHCEAFSIKDLSQGDTAGIMYLEHAEDIYFYNNFTHAIEIGGQGHVKNVHIYNNTLTMNSRAWRDMNYIGSGGFDQESEAQPLISIQTDFPETINIYNNIFYDSHHMPVLIYGLNWINSDKANVSNNIAFWRSELDNNSNGPWMSDNGLTSDWKWFNCSQLLNGNLCVDPQFTDINSFDFSLQLTSPAIDAGEIFSNNPLDDFYKTVRPQGIAPDIGAYESKAN